MDRLQVRISPTMMMLGFCRRNALERRREGHPHSLRDEHLIDPHQELTRPVSRSLMFTSIC